MKNPPTTLKHDITTDRAFVRWKGRKYYFGKWNSREAAREFAAWLHAASSETKPQITLGSATIGQCIDQYLTHAAKYYTEEGAPSKEFRNLRSALTAMVNHFNDDLQPADEPIQVEDFPAAKFGPLKLLAIQEGMVRAIAATKDGEPPRKKFARKTINAIINRIRRCFRWCVSRQLIPESVSDALDSVSGLAEGRTEAREEGPVRPVPIPIVIATLPFLSPTVSAMVRVQTLCGMRPQDVCRMKARGINMDADVWLYRPEKHKNSHRGKELVKAIPPSAQKILSDFWRDNPDEEFFSPAESLEYWRDQERVRQPKSAPKKKQRKPYTTESYGKSIVYAIRRAKKAGVEIPHWSPNQLRHSIGTQLRASIGIEAAQLFLGHENPDTTLIYAEKTAAELRVIARQLSSPFDDQRLKLAHPESPQVSDTEMQSTLPRQQPDASNRTATLQPQEN